MRRPLLWFSFKDHKGATWRVYLAAGRLTPELRNGAHNYDGVTYFDSRRILIDATLSRTEQNRTLLHELLHVAYGDTRPRLRRPSAEERVIKRIEGSTLEIFTQLGLRLPRRPRGVAALERWARSEDDEEEECEV